MTEYVVGFVFSPNRKCVALIEKNRPDWQKGRLNGIGGHIEPGETGIDAMIREFREETGVKIPEDQWKSVGVMIGPDHRVLIFKAETSDVFKIETKTDEKVNLYLVDALHRKETVPNLVWLIPMALSHRENLYFEIYERPNATHH